MTAVAPRAGEGDARRGPVRIVTAASLFDGHDAAINIMRRILQSQGAEVIHLGHDRSVEEIVAAAVEEGAHAVAISSYQGGHMEFFAYLVERLHQVGAGHVGIYGGGGGTITPDEVAQLHALGVARIFTPDDGRRLGLEGMVRQIIDECAATIDASAALDASQLGALVRDLAPDNPVAVSKLISWLEDEAGAQPALAATTRAELDRRLGEAPVLGFTGTGGAGKSSVVDAVVRQLRRQSPELRIGMLLVDPTRRRSGGALLGDRIRMNAIHGPGIFVRSMATRRANLALSASVTDGIRVMRAAGFDLVILETAGIGQSDSEIVDRVDLSVYVMTPDFGAPTQLEKIDMLDFADCVVLNKCDRRGAQDALRDVRKQWRRNRKAFDLPDAEVPVFATVARQWNDPGIARLHRDLRGRLRALGLDGPGQLEAPTTDGPAVAVQPEPMIPAARVRYLAEIAERVRGYRAEVEAQADDAALAGSIERVLEDMRVRQAPGADGQPAPDDVEAALQRRAASLTASLPAALREQLDDWERTREAYGRDTQQYRVRDRDISVDNFVETLAHTRLPKVATPRTRDRGELLRFLALENLPGRFPFTAGVFPFRRQGEEPTRMFAGEGGPERTNRRFHLLSRDSTACRLSTAFDSVTLYGRDPAPRPDIFGKVGNSGVSVCTLDDAKKLYSGIDLCAESTSVSLTINGPAPMVLAFFLNAAIDQQVERALRERGELQSARARFEASLPAGASLPRYGGELPAGHDGFGLGLLGIPGDQVIDADTYAAIKADVLRRVRGTVQADILKEDQAQNTCIFSTEFALKMQGDIQAYFVQRAVRNFYSVSVSGYHMAEAGANPITQLAFTLANGFTFCEYFLARGMEIDAFAPNLSFFFSNGLDAEYSVIGRVARRIWAVAMRDVYGASERSQKLKYHVQTSGRSLHAQEMSFNDIRTTLQALTALQDACNSLHTNAYDEAVTTPTEASVRRALAIQLIIQRELGVGKSENPIQGAYLTEELTDLVEAAVLDEFERLSARGGVLGAMELQYQRSKIQDESLYYESRKHSGELPVVGVNTFLGAAPEVQAPDDDRLIRSSDEEKAARLEALDAFHLRASDRAPAALACLQRVAAEGGNVFEELMETVKVASLGEISEALFAVGGQYRRAV